MSSQGQEGDRNPPERQSLPGVPAADWLGTLRAYLSEDWLTAALAEHLEVRASAAREARRLPCHGCGRRFQRTDLWIHHKYDDLGYCDGCYYRRFGRQPG